jgi:membrane-bound lytic murein transglycosylase D
VPPELAALPHVESSFNPKAVSHAGAAGMWQFTRGTGRRYLRVDHVVDERYDPWRSTEAAAQLLADNFGKLGSWPLAITAYNHGVTGMRRAVRETGTKRIGTIIDGYDGPYFGFASRNFYPALLAAAEIDAHPERFFGPVSLASRARVREVTLPHYIPVAVLERRLGISRAELRRSNPALREAVWDGRKFVPKGYHLRVPAAHTPSLAAGVAAIPLSERYGRQRPDRFHRVRRGQTLSAIAHRYGVRVAKLVAANGLSSRNFIRAGQRLRLPIAGAEPRPLADPAPPKDGGYVVRTGDTLARIARRYGVSMRELAALNGLDDPNLIRPGQRLRLGPEGELAAAEVDPAGGG